MSLSPRGHFDQPLSVLLSAAGGLLFLCLTCWKAMGLGDIPSRLPVVLALFLLFLFSFIILLGENGPSEGVLRALLPIGLALFLRAALLDHVTYDYLDFLSQWTVFFRENGGWAAFSRPVGNYTVTYLYFLAAISYLPVRDLYLIKLFSILFDMLLAWGGYRLVRTLSGRSGPRPLAAFCLLLLLPTVVLNGACWGQCDSIYTALCLHALASALEKRPAASVVLLALAFSFKLQTVFLLPLWCALWFSKRVGFRHLLLFPLTEFLVILPALQLGKPLGDILSVYLGQTAEYSGYLTMNAPSLYSLIPQGAAVNTALAARLGILSAFLFTAALLLWLFLHRNRLTSGALTAAAAALAIGIPLLLPHMHDRYFFPADVLTLTRAAGGHRQTLPAVFTQVASLGAYHAYLMLRYAFPMSWGALLLTAALVLTLWDLFRETALG